MSPDSPKLEERLREPVAPPDGHLTDFALEQLAISPALSDQHLESCDACRRRLVAIRAEREDFAQQVPAGQILAPAVERARRSRQRRLRWALAVAAPAISILLIAIGFFWMQGSQRIKGSVAVRLFVKRGDAVWQASPAEGFLPGDALRVQVTSSRPGYVRLLAREGGRLEPLVPDPGREPEQFTSGVALEAGEPLTLAGSFVLDAEPADEHLLVIVSEDPLPPEEARTLGERVLASGKARNQLPRQVRPGVWAVPIDLPRLSTP